MVISLPLLLPHRNHYGPSPFRKVDYDPVTDEVGKEDGESVKLSTPEGLELPPVVSTPEKTPSFLPSDGAK